MQDAGQLVMDAVNVGLAAMHKAYRQGISAFGGVSPTYWIALGADVPMQALQESLYRKQEMERILQLAV